MSTKTGSSRIPLFGTKKTYQPPQQDPIISYSTPKHHHHHLTDKDIGKLVRVAEKEGILRFIGKVLFSAGTWCGIELRSPTGKNDGSVFGVRYFQCEPEHGLMAPVSKVVLVDEELNVSSSGPFSILCGLDATIIKKGDETYTVDDEGDEETGFNDTVVLKRDEVIIDDGNCTVTYKNTRKLERPFEFGTPLLNSTITKLTPFTTEGGSKRDSLEFEESLGILTPDQMMDTANFPSSRTPSSENVNLLAQRKSAEGLNSPSQMDSLGIIDEKVLADMELPLESVGKFKDFVMARVEQTPSPEELPLDSTPIVKTQPEKANTFIVSISSITSLDTGYQGDGEMSRPASRGADNSPMTRRPLPRPQPRRNDPMTDSDFYTESDADNHEEHQPSRGDRLARVIDGTLYGADPQAAADLYANNRENMDSSGVFTDIETSTRTDDPNKTLVPSPSGSSTKTISYDSQTQKNTPQHKSSTETILKRSPSSIISSPSSVLSPIHAAKEEPAPKKYKMPKRNVPSKVKAMIGAGGASQQQKSVGVLKMNGKGVVEKTGAVAAKKAAEEAKARLKDVKSKVFSGSGRSGVEQKQKEARMISLRQNNGQKTANSKQRWPRPRIPAATSSPKTPRKQNESLQSSLSDLSGASPAKISTGSSKKRDVVNVTQVLTAAKLSSSSSSPNTPPQINNSAEVRKHRVHASPKNDSKTPRKKPFTSPKPKEKSSKTPKVATTTDKTECGRASVKGGRTSPNVRPQQTHTRAPVKKLPSSPDQRTVEALGVLIQHLVFNMEAFRVPTLKRQLEQAKQETEQSRLMTARLTEALEERNKQVAALETSIAQLLDERSQQVALLEEEKSRFHTRITQLAEEHATQIAKLKFQRAEVEQRLAAEQKALKEYQEREAAVQEQLEASINENDLLKDENSKLLSFCNDPDKSVQEVHSLRAVLELKQSEFAELRRMFAEAAEKAEQVPALEEKLSTLKARCEDLQLQLERKNLYEQQLLNEKKKLEESYKEECNQKRRLLQHKEELQWKLQQNKEVVNLVLEQAEENSSFNRSLLSASFNERHYIHQKPHFERTHSFRERGTTTTNHYSTRSTTSTCSLDSFNNQRLKTTTTDSDNSPPTSPKVKGVVEKSDSVSYVLDLDENPAVVASRIVRRSFRNTTPPKNTPTKSPANKRARTKSVTTPTKGSMEEENPFVFQRASSTPKPVAAEGGCFSVDSNGDLFEEEEDDLIDIPALPSEIGRKNDDAQEALSVSLHLSGEMESNSEDESTSSSSVQL